MAPTRRLLWIASLAVTPVACGGQPVREVAPRPRSAAGAVELAASSSLVCARMRAGDVRCWGRLGDEISRLPQEMPAFAGAESVHPGVAPCARLPKGAVQCFRADGSEYVSTKLKGAETVALRIDHEEDGSGALLTPQGCARFEGNAWRCWNEGELYDALPLAGARSVVLSPNLGCSLDARGSLRCWGRAIGDGTTLERNVPKRVLDGVVHAAVGQQHACAVLRDGTVRCWGNNDRGELGDGTTLSRTEPVRVAAIDDAIQVALGHRHSCALRKSGSVACWGADQAGQLGRGTNLDDASSDAFAATAGRVIDVTDARQVVAGKNFTCALVAGGDVRCWGSGREGGLGNGLPAAHSAPVAVRWSWEPKPSARLGSVEVLEVQVGESCSCARLSDGAVRCWGDLRWPIHNGHDGLAPLVTPKQIAGVVGARSLLGCHVAVLDGGKLQTWMGTTAATPLADWASVARLSGSGWDQRCTLTTAGQVRCRHRESEEALLPNPHQPSVAPLGGASDVTELSVDDFGGCALREDGSVWCWGQAGHSALDQQAMHRGVEHARRIEGIARAVQVAVGSTHACARLADRTVWCWGTRVLAGNGDPQSAMPTPVFGVIDAIDIQIGVAASCAVSKGGTVVCWGNPLHAPGVRATAELVEPKQVPWLHGAKRLAIGHRHSCAAFGGDVVRCWGDNDSGQLGDGTTAPREHLVDVRW